MRANRVRAPLRGTQPAPPPVAFDARSAVPVVVEGAKRGAGRRKRQRLVKAAIKQQETKKRLEEREQGRTKRIE